MFGSSEKEYCVLAIHTGNFPYPNFSIVLMLSIASLENSTPTAPYIFLAIFSTFVSILSSKSYTNFALSSFSHNSITCDAKSFAPSPPFAHASTKLKFIPCSCNFILNKSISASVSSTYLLIATITFNPNLFLILSICFNKLCIPSSNASIFSFCISSFATPP